MVPPAVWKQCDRVMQAHCHPYFVLGSKVAQRMQTAYMKVPSMLGAGVLHDSTKSGCGGEIKGVEAVKERLSCWAQVSLSQSEVEVT